MSGMISKKLNKMKVCVVIVDRANYGRLRPVMSLLKADDGIQLQTICAGTTLLDRFGSAINQIIKDGFSVDASVYLEVEGSTPLTMAKSVGMGVMEFASAFDFLKPDLVLIIGDRYEAMAATLAAGYMNLQIAHIQGGEVSGSIDESTRHAITKFANLHFPATKRAAEYILRLGEPKDIIHNVGCPAGDYILSLDEAIPEDLFINASVGAKVSAHEPYILVVFHPVTTDILTQTEQVTELLSALEQIAMPTVWLWPNIDAGSNDISKVLRKYRENHADAWLCFVKNLSPVLYAKALKNAACAVGNSSSFVRDSTFSGTPVVLVGNRQDGREFGRNLLHCRSNQDVIYRSIQAQLAHGRYPPDTLYGCGDASAKIVYHIKRHKPVMQKKLSYVFDL